MNKALRVNFRVWTYRWNIEPWNCRKNLKAWIWLPLILITFSIYRKSIWDNGPKAAAQGKGNE